MISSDNLKNANTPKTTNNSLADIVGWLKLGDTVILHNNGEQKKVYFILGSNLNRKIYVNVSSFPSLLGEGEWPYYIESVSAKQVTDDNVECPNGTFYFSVPALNSF